MNAHHAWILVSLHTNATNLKNMIDILPKIVKPEQATIPLFMCRTLMIKQRDITCSITSYIQIRKKAFHGWWHAMSHACSGSWQL